MNYVEEQAFSDVCIALLAAGIDEKNIENSAHSILDAFTFDGKLNVEALYDTMNGQ